MLGKQERLVDNLSKQLVETRFCDNHYVAYNGYVPTCRGLETSLLGSGEGEIYMPYIGDGVAQIGYRIWYRKSTDDVSTVGTELTNGEPQGIVSQAVNGRSVKSSPFNCQQLDVVKLSSVLIRFYLRKEGDAWTFGTYAPMFSTPILYAKKLNAGTWDIKIDIQKYFGGTYTYVYLFFGTVNSTRIENFSYLRRTARSERFDKIEELRNLYGSGPYSYAVKQQYSDVLGEVESYNDDDCSWVSKVTKYPP